MLNEPVHIEPYDSQWSEMFDCERDRIARVTQAPLEDIQHIGSTAVPNLSAKPIVDIMLGVGRYPPDPLIVQSLAANGYESMGEAGVPSRVYLRKRSHSWFNVHVVERGGVHWVANLQLREYLRSSAEARERYSAVKQAALAAGATDLLSYSEYKAAIVSRLLSEASAFARRS